MKTQQIGTEETSNQEARPKNDKNARRAPFCLRLNALRALACISVICTHIVGYHDLRGPFRSLDYGGHMAVYFFFSLSGYLLSLSLVKEVRRRVNLEKKSTQTVQKPEDSAAKIDIEHSNAPHVELSAPPKSELSRLITLFKQTKQPVVVSVLGKYLWNRTLRLFPLYYGCWCFLKLFARENTHVHSLQMGNLWTDILLLKIFPGHLWTMRIEMMFYYYVIPLYIICLCIAFDLQKRGLKRASSVCFFSIMCALLFVAINKMNLEEDIIHPVKISENFLENLPPFLFGMLAALVNFALELKFNNAQKAETKETVNSNLNEIQIEEDSLLISQGKDQILKKVVQKLWLLAKAVSSRLSKSLWNTVFVVVLLRIIMLNPGVNKSFFTANNEIPEWQMANRTSYWYAIFIFINDTRGGFWKFTHLKSQSQSSLSGVSFCSKIIYYFGLWSYPIYLTHPISYVTLAHSFPKTKVSVDVNVLAIFGCLVLGGVADFVIDKMLVNKLILGKFLRFKKN